MSLVTEKHEGVDGAKLRKTCQRHRPLPVVFLHPIARTETGNVTGMGVGEVTMTVHEGQILRETNTATGPGIATGTGNVTAIGIAIVAARVGTRDAIHGARANPHQGEAPKVLRTTMMDQVARAQQGEVPDAIEISQLLRHPQHALGHRLRHLRRLRLNLNLNLNLNLSLLPDPLRIVGGPAVDEQMTGPETEIRIEAEIETVNAIIESASGSETAIGTAIRTAEMEVMLVAMAEGVAAHGLESVEGRLVETQMMDRIGATH